MQKILSAEQVEAFYHDEFVDDQVRHFVSMFGAEAGHKRVVDMGGGCGFFAKQLASQTDYQVKVIDMDPASVDACHAAGIDAEQGDAIRPKMTGMEDIVCFNLILHHLIGDSDDDTLALQTKALAAWLPHVRSVFVNEYIYESYCGNLSGWLIFSITKSAALSWIGKLVAVVVPSLKANTFGVGVRFRASQEWRSVFEAAGYSVKSVITGKNEPVSLPRRVLLIKHIRRDSFVLEPKAGHRPKI